MRWQRAAVVLGMLPCIAAAKTGISTVTGIRSWSHADSTRVIIQTTGPVEYKVDRAVNPDRLFFDLLHARPLIDHKRFASRLINDRFVRRVRIAETAPGVTRIVFDLTGPEIYHVSKLEAPDRLVIEIGAPPPPLLRELFRRRFRRLLIRRVRLRQPDREQCLLAGVPPQVEPRPLYPPYLFDTGRILAPARPPRPSRQLAFIPAPVAGTSSAATAGAASGSLAAKVAPQVAYQPVVPESGITPALRSTLRGPLHNDSASKASENASRSLTRALGLKVNRIVIDAGHGGHDQGTNGPNGVLEKEMVLDVALRLAKLVETRMGAEVVLTRSDDTFIPLAERSAIANSHKADLFLSIHANSSPAPSVAGTETFFLNFTNSPGALDVAARENAGADKSVGELRDLIQSITMNDKIAESQTFAQSVQTSIFSQASRSNVAARNRGVKRAPFVVLIGASMPSVLAEIGFLTNPRDEANLAKPEYREKIAEALYKGVLNYSQSLSHFDIAGAAGKTAEKTDRTVVSGLNQD